MRKLFSHFVLLIWSMSGKELKLLTKISFKIILFEKTSEIFFSNVFAFFLFLVKQKNWNVFNRGNFRTILQKCLIFWLSKRWVFSKTIGLGQKMFWKIKKLLLTKFKVGRGSVHESSKNFAIVASISRSVRVGQLPK